MMEENNTNPQESIFEEEIKNSIETEDSNELTNDSISASQDAPLDSSLDEQTEEISLQENLIQEQSSENTQETISTPSDEETTAPQELVTVRPVKFQKFDNIKVNRAIKKNLDILQDVSMHISVELGRAKSSIKDVMEIEKGSVVELEKIAGEQVEIYVNEKLVAKGEVMVIEDKFGVRVTSTNLSTSHA